MLADFWDGIPAQVDSTWRQELKTQVSDHHANCLHEFPDGHQTKRISYSESEFDDIFWLNRFKFIKNCFKLVLRFKKFIKKQKSFLTANLANCYLISFKFWFCKIQKLKIFLILNIKIIILCLSNYPFILIDIDACLELSVNVNK